MMRLDTSGIAGWEDRTVVLEFEHGRRHAGFTDADCRHIPAYWDAPDGGDPDPEDARMTAARLVEFFAGESMPSSTEFGEWTRVPSGWKRMLYEAVSRCSLEDQFCRETGRRVALRHMAKAIRRPPSRWLTAAERDRLITDPLVVAAIQQYFQDRAARKRKGAAA